VADVSVSRSATSNLHVVPGAARRVHTAKQRRAWKSEPGIHGQGSFRGRYSERLRFRCNTTTGPSDQPAGAQRCQFVNWELLRGVVAKVSCSSIPVSPDGMPFKAFIQASRLRWVGARERRSNPLALTTAR
jgi:hypothetical protein